MYTLEKAQDKKRKKILLVPLNRNGMCYGSGFSDLSSFVRVRSIA